MKLRSPEEIKASKIEATAKYLEHAENVLSELIGPLFGPEDERIQGTNELSSMYLIKAMGLRQLVMAMRRYPIFDPSCLSSMKKYTHKVQTGSEWKEIQVLVPTFGVAPYRSGIPQATFNLNSERNVFELGSITKIYFNFDSQRRNDQAMRAARVDQTWGAGELRAAMPTVPVDVQKRVDEVSTCFDHISVVWEAEWGPAPVVDPLIIGSVDEYHFLVDQYDVTKLERYISSEMTKRPLK
jgi:hypothetical protein